ncbi:DMT family transporter [Raoultella ornithinolytica]|uniref:DMT family transporter n=1 Tax=Raoultella ornithinolytica TaxID=54291 RepID=UPI001E34EB30|nr:DMT family transporter [Raoultella ornithinolytica]MCC2034708.1 DMT family transporter [Raoultella ornithinolytica]MCC2040577.1 DMT family transporter [Raoultella ornithinolytica]MCC2049138.1 DMT family transporter [Raoultella ornithinolytica]MCC2050942.1 DMT family transporter [Raoultella ornithinolytica]MCC2055604.1 DMT family transporter [Raoultella ornithinolytica]
MVNSTAYKTAPGSASGWLNGLLGVVIFSGSLPATRVAVVDIDPFFLTFLRATIAGALAMILIFGYREKRPRADQLLPLLVVSLGVVVGFPLLTAMALQHVTSAHSIVFLGLLPLATAIFGVIRGGERPTPIFWLFSGMGSLLVMGYAEGAKLTRVLGGWQVISWALIISLPFMLTASILTLPASFSQISASAWLALGYVSLFSMLIGFIFWYKGLAAGGIAAVGQLQLLQPFLGLTLSATLLHEVVSPLMILITLGVILCVIGSRKFAR